MASLREEAEWIRRWESFRVPLKAYLASDHLSPGTGLSLVVLISKNGGPFLPSQTGASVATEIANGWYYFDLNGLDTQVNGPLVLRATHASIDPVEIRLRVVGRAKRYITVNVRAASEV